MPYLYAPEELDHLLAGETAYRLRQLREWLYRHPVLDATSMTNLPGELRGRLATSLWPFKLEQERSTDNGNTRKWLFRRGMDQPTKRC